MEYRPINEKISDQEMLVIDQDGNKLGKLTKQEALQRARDANLDLVLFVPKEKTGSLPIVKIIDFGKFNYEEKLKQKQSKKNQSIILTKEVKVRPQIGSHDLQWRANQAKEWLAKNIQIKFKIQAYGRIGYKPELIEETYQKFLNLIGDSGKIIMPLKKLTPVMYEATIAKK